MPGFLWRERGFGFDLWVRRGRNERTQKAVTKGPVSGGRPGQRRYGFGMQLLGRIDRYILGMMIKPMVAVVGVALLLLLLDNMLGLFEFTITEGQPAWVVAAMLASLLPEYFGLAIPIGLLLGATLTYRSLSISNELEAMFNAGVSYLRLLRAPILMSMIFMAITFALIGFAQPKAEYLLQELIYRVRTGQFAMSVKSGVFNRLTDKVTMRMERVDGDAGLMRSVFLQVDRADSTSMMLTAASGKFFGGKDRDTVVLRLNKGVVVENRPNAQQPDVLKFDLYDFPIRLPEAPAFRERGSRDVELTLPELWLLAHDDSATSAERQNADGRFHRGVIQGLMVLLFPFLALPMGLAPQRSPTLVGLFLGMAAYITILKALDFAAAATLPGSWLLQWILFAVFTSFTMLMYYATSRGKYPLTGFGSLITAWRQSLWNLVRPGDRPSTSHGSTR